MFVEVVDFGLTLFRILISFIRLSSARGGSAGSAEPDTNLGSYYDSCGWRAVKQDRIIKCILK